MNTPLIPCETTPGDLWFADNHGDGVHELEDMRDTREQRVAAKLCEGCPLSRHAACREEGWKHEYGVWGGLTPMMRKRMAPRRYAEAVATAELMSLEVDDIVTDVKGRMELVRIRAGAARHGFEPVFEVEPEDAELLAIEDWGSGRLAA